MNDFEILDFDTNLFGFKVARVNRLIDDQQVDDLINALKKEQVRLVYWIVKPENEFLLQKIKSIGGILVDQKATFLKKLTGICSDSYRHERELVDVYNEPSANQAMIELAYKIGHLSRFGKDPNMSEELMKKMYASWINNSIKTSLASHVFIIKRKKDIAGMITLGEKNQRGDIGLVSVSDQYQGQGIATTLVRAALYQFIEEGYAYSQVVTQLDNQAACNLYKKCGYELETVEHFYHLWL